MKIVDKRKAKEQLRRCALAYGEVYRNSDTGRLYIATRVAGECVPIDLADGMPLGKTVADTYCFVHVEAEVVLK